MLEKLRLSRYYNLLIPVNKIVEFVLWYLRDKTPPTPHIVKESKVKKFAKINNISCFIETGTYLGVMIDAVKSDFEKIYSIELDKELFERAKLKFESEKNIKILNGDSSKILPRVLTKIKTRSIFWLDAHYSGGFTARSKKDTPVMQELKVILKHNVKDHIILIDDADLFVGKNGYPTVAELKKILKRKSNKYSLRIDNNIFIVERGQSLDK